MLSSLTSDLTRALLLGLSLGVAFNPVTALVGSAGAAMVGTLTARRGGRAPWWLLVAAAAWAIGDGVTVLAAAATLGRGSGALLGAAAPLWAGWLLLATWALSGFAFGYVVPAAVGIAVGRRVTFGTGWLAAAAVAGTLCLAFLALSAPLGDALRHLAV